MKSHTLTRGAALAGALMLAPAATASAATGGESTPLHLSGSTAVRVSSGGSSGIVRTIVGLFIVIAVIYGVAWLLRAAKGGKNRSSGHGLSQLATLPLGGGRSVALVRAGQEVVLVGIAEQGVTPIRTYTEEEALELGLLDDTDTDADPGSGAGTGRAPGRTGARRRVSARGPRGGLVDTMRRLTVRS